jgi:hypothetical protein
MNRADGVAHTDPDASGYRGLVIRGPFAGPTPANDALKLERLPTASRRHSRQSVCATAVAQQVANLRYVAGEARMCFFLYFLEIKAKVAPIL